MSKKLSLVVLIVITALLLMILVYVYFQNKLEAMDKKHANNTSFVIKDKENNQVNKKSSIVTTRFKMQKTQQMKKCLLFLSMLTILVIKGMAQAPNAIPYQGVARNAAGNILSS